MRLVGARATLAGLAFTVLATLLLSDRIKRQTPDLEVYWRAGVRAAAGEPLYRASDGHYQFKYLPAFAVPAILLTAHVVRRDKWQAKPAHTAGMVFESLILAIPLMLIALGMARS